MAPLRTNLDVHRPLLSAINRRGAKPAGDALWVSSHIRRLDETIVSPPHSVRWATGAGQIPTPVFGLSEAMPPSRASLIGTLGSSAPQQSFKVRCVVSHRTPQDRSSTREKDTIESIDRLRPWYFSDLGLCRPDFRDRAYSRQIRASKSGGKAL
jgi:ribosomal protein S14